VQPQIELARQIQIHWFQRWTEEDSAPREFRDLTTEIQAELLSLGNDILRAIAELSPWQQSPGALEGLQPVFVDGIVNGLLSNELKAQLFHAISAVEAAMKDVSSSRNPSTRTSFESNTGRHVQSNDSSRDALAGAR